MHGTAGSIVHRAAKPLVGSFAGVLVRRTPWLFALCILMFAAQETAWGEPSVVHQPSFVGALADSIVHLLQWRLQDGGNDHWYGVLATTYNWLQASALAPTFQVSGQPGYLATIKSSAENAFVFDSIVTGLNPGTVQDQFYLGGYRVGAFWTWTSGEPFCYVNWAPGEPNNADETVISMWGPRHSLTGTWNNTLPHDSANAQARFWAVLEWGPLDTFVTSQCGNQVVECSEQCDDGNTTPGDGCDSGCRNEPAVCGDGVVEYPEECEDGNLTPGDGCEPTCIWTPICGNGRREQGEECDDSNLVAGDCCDTFCQFEETPECCKVPLPGDINGDNIVSSSDIITLLNFVFKGGGPPPYPCIAAGDINCSGTVTSADIIALVNYIFKSGLPPCDICGNSSLRFSCF